jgi:chromosome segregation ATPase
MLLLQGSVQEQLEALWDLSPVCAPARLRKQRKANEQLESDNTQLQSDKAQLQAEVLALRTQLEHSQAQVLQLQQQLTAAQSGDQQG